MTGLAAATSFAAGYATALAGPDASVDQRVKVLEDNLDRLTKAFFGEQQQTRERFMKVATEIREERQARTAEQQQIHDRLKEVQTGGLGAASMGWLWVAVGSFLSTASAELTNRYAQFGALLGRAIRLVL